MKTSSILAAALSLGAATVQATLCPMPPADLVTRNVTTSDGVNLQYMQAGPLFGEKLLFIPGWRQTAAQWCKQIAHFSEQGYRVTTYDMRGHGESDAPENGYRISRFATDLKDVLVSLGLYKVSIISHSMGSSVSWAFWDQYPELHHVIEKFVFVDQSAILMANPEWTSQEKTDLAALFTYSQAYDYANNMHARTPPFVKSMFTPNVTEADYQFALMQNWKMKDENAATLLLNHAAQDWRAVLPSIDVPSMVLAGDLSVNPAVGIQWVASQIPGAMQYNYTFSAEQKGSHFAFWEDAATFNRVVEDFLVEA